MARNGIAAWIGAFFLTFEFGLVLRQVYDRMRDVVGSQPHQLSEKIGKKEIQNIPTNGTAVDLVPLLAE